MIVMQYICIKGVHDDSKQFFFNKGVFKIGLIVDLVMFMKIGK